MSAYKNIIFLVRRNKSVFLFVCRAKIRNAFSINKMNEFHILYCAYVNTLRNIYKCIQRSIILFSGMVFWVLFQRDYPEVL